MTCVQKKEEEEKKKKKRRKKTEEEERMGQMPHWRPCFVLGSTFSFFFSFYLLPLLFFHSYSAATSMAPAVATSERSLRARSQSISKHTPLSPSRIDSSVEEAIATMHKTEGSKQSEERKHEVRKENKYEENN